MKKALFKTALFLLPVMVVFILFPIDRRDRYNGLKEDCFNHGIWLYDRLFYSQKPIDIAFIGSSHTVNGINDKLIEDSLKSTGLTVANFGYCRLGRNLSYVLLKELFSVRHPKAIVVEVMEDEDRYSHPIFPYIARTADVFAPVLLFNRDIFADMHEAISYKLTLIQQYLFADKVFVPISNEAFGFACSSDTASFLTLLEVKKKRSEQKSDLSLAERNFYMRYPRSYLNNISEICKQHNANLIFLYLAGYGSKESFPKENDTYSRYGMVWIPPDSITNNTSYWKDENHYNQAGAASLSRWLAAELKEKIK